MHLYRLPFWWPSATDFPRRLQLRPNIDLVSSLQKLKVEDSWNFFSLVSYLQVLLCTSIPYLNDIIESGPVTDPQPPPKQLQDLIYDFRMVIMAKHTPDSSSPNANSDGSGNLPTNESELFSQFIQ